MAASQRAFCLLLLVSVIAGAEDVSHVTLDEAHPLTEVYRFFPDFIQLVDELMRQYPPRPEDCVDIYRYVSETSGEYTVYLDAQTAIEVYCDQETDGGGWTVFLRRVNGTVDFNRNWRNYKNGFGNMQDNFWLGLEDLHAMTSQQPYDLRVDLKTLGGYESANATYANFSVSGESDLFRLNLGNFTGGNAGDSLSFHRGMQFSTRDRFSHNNYSDYNCARHYKGGWWFKDCHHSLLTGLYSEQSYSSEQDGIMWRAWKWMYTSLGFSEMKMRPSNKRP